MEVQDKQQHSDLQKDLSARLAATQHSSVRLDEGRWALIRPIKKNDIPLVKQIYQGMCDHSRYLRFYAQMRLGTSRFLSYVSTITSVHSKGIIAIDPETREPLGNARFVRVDVDKAEFAISIRDSAQGIGLGLNLLQGLVELAKTHQVKYLVAHVSMDNIAMLHIIRKLGMVVDCKGDLEFSTFTIHIDHPAYAFFPAEVDIAPA